MFSLDLNLIFLVTVRKYFLIHLFLGIFLYHSVLPRGVTSSCLSYLPTSFPCVLNARVLMYVSEVKILLLNFIRDMEFLHSDMNELVSRQISRCFIYKNVKNYPFYGAKCCLLIIVLVIACLIILLAKLAKKKN